MLRKQIIKKYITVDDIFHIIGHNPSIFVGMVVKTILFLLVLYVIYYFLAQYIQWPLLPWIFAILGIGFFIKYMIDFFDLYLDSLLLSKEGMTLFMRDGLLKHKTDFFEWNRIETVSYRYHTVWDKVFSKGDLMIKLDRDIEFPFENVSSPQKQMAKILKYKQQFSTSSPQKELDMNDERVSILAEALGEVVKEYLEKKDAEEEEEY